jgi:serine/threonine protein kinase
LPRNDILGALLRLSKSSKLYPECLTITDLERDDDVLDSGRFGEIYKGRSRNQAICLKIIKVNRKTQIKHLLKVRQFGAFNNPKCLTSQTVFKEALLWGHLSHPNILPFYGIYHLEDTHGRISFVSPWMENGNVTEYLKRHPLANRLLLVRPQLFLVFM